MMPEERHGCSGSLECVVEQCTVFNSLYLCTLMLLYTWYHFTRIRYIFILNAALGYLLV